MSDTKQNPACGKYDMGLKHWVVKINFRRQSGCYKKEKGTSQCRLFGWMVLIWFIIYIVELVSVF